ncbi:MAG: hypothetical protein IKZ07_07245 [Akkermansia sp.]|nr:hypothetical protein [Akkermansia sp.]
MTNRELQDLLKQYRDDEEVRIECLDYEGCDCRVGVEKVFYDRRIIIVAESE